MIDKLRYSGGGIRFVLVCVGDPLGARRLLTLRSGLTLTCGLHTPLELYELRIVPQAKAFVSELRSCNTSNSQAKYTYLSIQKVLGFQQLLPDSVYDCRLPSHSRDAAAEIPVDGRKTLCSLRLWALSSELRGPKVTVVIYQRQALCMTYKMRSKLIQHILIYFAKNVDYS